MAVIEVKELTERPGSIAASSVEYTRTFRVRVDSPSDNLQSIYNATSGQLPRYLEPHPDNVFATCRSMPAKQPTKHWQWWEFRAEYTTAPLTNEERERKEQNPINRKARISWSRNRYAEPTVKDRFGKAILNSAGDYYDPPPERLTGYWVATVKKNVGQIPTWLLDYDNVVNQSSFSIQGRQVLPRCALFVPGSISDEQEENGVRFYELTYELEFRRKPDIPGSQILSPDTKKPVSTFGGHDLITLDQGLRYAVTEGNVLDIGVFNIKDDNGDDITSPAPLDGKGGKLDQPAPDTVFYFAYEIYRPVDFSVLPLT